MSFWSIHPINKFRYALFHPGMYVLLLLALHLLSPISTQAFEAEASLSHSEVEVGETFQIVVSVQSNTSAKDLPWPTLSGDLTQFKLDKSTQTSTQRRIMNVNGQVTRENIHITQFIFNLTAKQAGTYPLGPISFRHEGVEKNLGKGEIRVTQAEAGMDLQQTLSPRTLYIGQQMSYNLRILEKTPINNIVLPQISQEIGQNFYFQHLTENAEATTYKEKGREYRAWNIPIAFFPLVGGPLTLPSFQIKYQQMVRSRPRSQSLFDMFESQMFGGRAVEKNAQTSSQSLVVLPLPAGAPSGFSGAVGKYRISSKISHLKAKTGDAVTLTLSLEGDGQPKGVKDPIFPKLTGWEIFEPEEAEKTEVKNGRLYTKKTLTYTLIPTHPGKAKIDSVVFVYFDPGSKNYQTLQTETYTVDVAPGPNQGNAGTTQLTQYEIRQLGTDIRHIHTPAQNLKPEIFDLHKNPLYYLSYLLAPLILLISFISYRRKQLLQQNIAFRRKRFAQKHLRQRLKQAQKYLSENNQTQFYQEIQTALERYLSDLLNLEIRGKTRDELLVLFAESGIAVPTQNDLLSFMEKCDLCRFGGGQLNSTPQTQLTHLQNLISTLNKELKV